MDHKLKNSYQIYSTYLTYRLQLWNLNQYLTNGPKPRIQTRKQCYRRQSARQLLRLLIETYSLSLYRAYFKPARKQFYWTKRQTNKDIQTQLTVLDEHQDIWDHIPLRLLGNVLRVWYQQTPELRYKLPHQTSTEIFLLFVVIVSDCWGQKHQRLDFRT